MSEPSVSFVHSGNVGDVIWALPTIKSILKLRGCAKAKFYLHIDVPAGYVKGIQHPCGQVQMTRAFANSLMPLLQAQSYIESVKIWAREHVDVDLDAFRRSGFDHGRGDIGRYYCHVMAAQPCLWEPWLEVPASPSPYILVNRTNRYHNHRLKYGFLAGRDDVRFVGLEREYHEFKQHCNCQWLRTDTFYDLAKAIAGCRLFIGNQSSAFAMAQGLMVPRILEISDQAPNVVVNGPNGWDAWRQQELESCFRHVVG